MDIQSLFMPLGVQVVTAIMDAEVDQLCGDGANNRNGNRGRLVTCVGMLNLGVPQLWTGGFFPEDVLEHHRRVDRALVAAVAEMCATGTSTRKVQRVAEKMGIGRLGRGRVGTIAVSLDAEIADLARDVRGALDTLNLARRDLLQVPLRGRAASTAAVTAIGCDESGWRQVLGVSVVGHGVA